MCLIPTRDVTCITVTVELCRSPLRIKCMICGVSSGMCSEIWLQCSKIHHSTLHTGTHDDLLLQTVKRRRHWGALYSIAIYYSLGLYNIILIIVQPRSTGDGLFVKCQTDLLRCLLSCSIWSLSSTIASWWRLRRLASDDSCWTLSSSMSLRSFTSSCSRRRVASPCTGQSRDSRPHHAFNACRWYRTPYTIVTASDSEMYYCARQHICYSAYMLSPVRLSVRPSVCHTGGSVKNGWR